MRPPRELDQLVKVARMYYQDGLSQQEIAAALGTTRSNVSRILTAARDTGVVEIRINEPLPRLYDVEDMLTERFGLREAFVMANQPGDPAAIAGRVAAEWLMDQLQPGQRVALSWGGALQAMVRAVPSKVVTGVEVVQLVGGLSALTLQVSGQELVRELADSLGCRYRYLHAPALFESAKVLRALVKEPSIATALDAARQADIACVGIGTAGTGSSVEIVNALHLTPAEREAFDAAGAVGDICARYFDENGSEVRSPVHEHVLAVGLDDLRAIPTVLGVATGAAKAAGIRGALRGGLLDVLVCDEAAARGVLGAAGSIPD